MLTGNHNNNRNLKGQQEFRTDSPEYTAQLKEAANIHRKKGNDAIAELSISILGLIETGILTQFPIDDAVELTQDITTIVNEGLQGNVAGLEIANRIYKIAAKKIPKSFSKKANFIWSTAKNGKKYGTLLNTAISSYKSANKLQNALKTGKSSKEVDDIMSKTKPYRSASEDQAKVKDMFANNLAIFGIMDDAVGIVKNLTEIADSTYQSTQEPSVELSPLDIIPPTELLDTPPTSVHNTRPEPLQGLSEEEILKTRLDELNISERQLNSKLGLSPSFDGYPPTRAELKTIESNLQVIDTERRKINSEFKHPELASGEIQGKFGNMNTQTNTTKKKKTNKPSFWNRFSSNQYVNISREELRAKYKAHRAREIQNDPSMEYFYSSKYQDEHQNMFGTISCSNINPSEAHNFSSPVGGSFTSPFSSLSNEIAPFKIPPFLTIDDILRNPKIKEFTQNIAGNEAHKQLCSYDRELHESFQDESPLSDEDRSTMEDAHDLIAYINRVGAERIS